VIRAMVGYALRKMRSAGTLPRKYAPLMSGEADRRRRERQQAADNNSVEFALIAKMAASVDTLDGFPAEMKIDPGRHARRPAAETVKGEPVHTGPCGDYRVETGRSHAVRAGPRSSGAGDYAVAGRTSSPRQTPADAQPARTTVRRKPSHEQATRTKPTHSLAKRS